MNFTAYTRTSWINLTISVASNRRRLRGFLGFLTSKQQIAVSSVKKFMLFFSSGIPVDGLRQNVGRQKKRSTGCTVNLNLKTFRETRKFYLILKTNTHYTRVFEQRACTETPPPITGHTGDLKDHGKNLTKKYFYYHARIVRENMFIAVLTRNGETNI